MKLINTILASITISLFFISNSYSQGVIQQFGPLIAGDLIMSQGNNRAVDAGSSIVPTVPSTRIIGGVGVVNSINGYCQWDQDPGNNTAWDQLCLGFNNNIGSITYNNIGTPTNPLTFSVNGFTSLSLNNSGAALLGHDIASNPSPSSSDNTIATTLFVQQLVGTSGAAAIPWVGSNAALEALSTVTSTRAMRCGVTASNDAPCVVFLASNSSCTISGGDIGSEVPSADGKCWLVSAQTDYDIRNWGLPANPVNFYVSTAGNDYGSPGSGANYCVVAANPCLTFAQVQVMAYQFDMAGGDAWVNVGAGTWAQSFQLAGPLRGAGNGNAQVGGQMGQFVIDGAGPSTIIIGDPVKNFAIRTNSYADVSIYNVTLEDVNAGAANIWAENTSIQNVESGVVFGGGASQLVHLEETGTLVNFWASFTVFGGAHAAFLADNPSSIVFNPVGGSPTVTFVGTPVFTSEIFTAAYGANIFVGSTWDFSGAVTGPAFLVFANGNIYYAGVTLPGTAGTMYSGGVVDPGMPPVSMVDTSGGLGVGGSVGRSGDANDYAGSIEFSTGSSDVKNNGAITITFANKVAERSCVVSLLGSWGISASLVKIPSSPSDTTLMVTWANGGVNLPINNIGGYGFTYNCSSQY